VDEDGFEDSDDDAGDSDCDWVELPNTGIKRQAIVVLDEIL
jgi:hypothetical protein